MPLLRTLPPANRPRLKATTYPVRIFSVDPKYGTDNPYTLADLKQIVSNWNTYQQRGSPGFHNPQAVYLPMTDIGIGHGQDELVKRELMKRMDLPSAGEPKRVWLSGLDLFAELVNVPEPIADLCDSGQLRSISSEIYPNYVGPYGQRFGPVLGRISFLGSYPPRLKGLGAIPPFRFQEPAAHGRPAQQVVTVFGETIAMTIDEAKKLLESLGLTPPEGSPDAWIILLATKLQEYATPTQANPEGGGAGGGNGMMPGITPDQFADRVFANISQRVAAQVAAGNLPVLTRLNEMATTFGGIVANTDRQECEVFAETNRERLYPFEMDKTNAAYIVGRLVKMPKEMRLSEMAAIASRPKVSTFGEQMPGRDADASGHGRVVAGGNEAPSAARIAELAAHSAIGKAIQRRQAAAALNN